MLMLMMMMMLITYNDNDDDNDNLHIYSAGYKYVHLLSALKKWAIKQVKAVVWAKNYNKN